MGNCKRTNIIKFQGQSDLGLHCLPSPENVGSLHNDNVAFCFPGLTAGQVCYCPRVKKQLPTKLQSTLERLERNKSVMALKPGLQDKDAIFRLASNPKSFYELQKKLQVWKFNALLIFKKMHLSMFSPEVGGGGYPGCGGDTH